MNDPIDRHIKAVRVLMRFAGRGRAYADACAALYLAGYTDEEVREAVKRWRRWKRETKEVER